LLYELAEVVTMKTKYLTSLLFLVVACSGGQTTSGGGGQTTLELKEAAANAKANDTAHGDACQEHDWYGDGECDRFCASVDSVDCTPTTGDDDVACAAFIEKENGVCDRKPADPCIGQDPDCDDLVCAAIAEEPDGKCDHDAKDACAFYQDPDCSTAGPTDPPADDPLICPAIAQEADGICPRYNTDEDPCAFYQDPDCVAVDPLPTDPDPGTPSCKIAPEAADGVCSREANDPCLAADPDCVAVACAAYFEQSDGVCKREPTDPCIFQDPDCLAK
jgi:hypothetical protein